MKMKTRSTNWLFERRKSSLTRIINEKAAKGFLPKSITPFGFITYVKGEPDRSVYVVEGTTAPRDLRLQDETLYEKVLTGRDIVIYRSLAPRETPVYSEVRDFEGWQYHEETAWLSEKASEGLMLSDKRGDEYFFVKRAPDSVEFNVDYSVQVNAQQYLRSFAAAGWKFVCSSDNTHYFYRKKVSESADDIAPLLNEIRSSLRTGRIFAIQSCFTTLLGLCGMVLPSVYGLTLGWDIVLGVIGAVVMISGVATLCSISTTNHRLRKRRRMLRYKQGNGKK